MVKLKIGGREVAMVKFFAATDKAAAFEFVETRPGASVVCLDTPPTPVFGEFVRELTEVGRVVIVRDHHDVAGDPKSPRNVEIRAAADSIRAVCGANTVVSNRVANPACSSLIVAGEFAGDEFMIVADQDMDGLTAAMKALGVVYHELDTDAAILDGTLARKTREFGLSSLGELLVKGSATLPPFNDRNYEVAAQELYGSWVAATQGDSAALESLATKVAKFEEMVVKAKALAATATEVAPGCWLVDVTGQHGFHLGTLSASLEARPGCKVTIVRKDDGPIAKIGGVQYSFARHSADKDTDLKSLFPAGFKSSPEEGYIGNVPFLVHCGEKQWAEHVRVALLEKFGRRDICGYCGADNGPMDPQRGGIYRNGFDCCYCGGN